MVERKKTWDEKVDLVKQSFDRSKQRKTFASIFYQNLFFLKPKIRTYFKNTDLIHQEKAVMAGMKYLMAFLDEKNRHARQQILRIAGTHSAKNLNIHPHDYYYWLEALIMTAKECDHLWQEDFQYYWRECLSFPITFIISQYYVEHLD